MITLRKDPQYAKKILSMYLRLILGILVFRIFTKNPEQLQVNLTISSRKRSTA